MQKIPKGIVAIAIVIVISGLAFYYQFFGSTGLPADRVATPVMRPESATLLASREVSVETSYDVPEADLTHNIKFTAALDAEGRIVEMRMVEMSEGKSSDKQQEFASALTVMIKGKKLSELSKVDKVGKSTLTTDAFNAALGDLKAQL